MRLMRLPPPLKVTVSWRALYERGAFAQRELVSNDRFRSAANERELQIGLGRDPFEDLDLNDALRPIAFSLGPYVSGSAVPAEPAVNLRFREEEDANQWDTYAWEVEPGYSTVSALYSPWQLLYLDDVLRGTGADIAVETLLLPEPGRGEQVERLRGFFEIQDQTWRSIDDSWRPLIKVLVRLQTYYWPRVTGRVNLLHGPEPGTWVEAGEEARPDFTLDAERVRGELGATSDELTSAYYFLVERGLDREPNDGLVMLRRARPRAYHIRWRGAPRRAQDHFNAAEVLRRFLTDLSGEPPPHPPTWPMDGRQHERARLYERGPAAPFEPAEVKAELETAELYPHGVHVVGEGASERLVVETLVGSLLGWGAVEDELTFSDLGGSGAAARIEELVRTLSAYSRRTVVIVDREGLMAEYLNGAVKRGTIEREDVLLFDDSLEASNASAAELVELARNLAANPPLGREPAELRLDPDSLEKHHADRRMRAPKGGKPGLAESLIDLARREEHGSVELDKLELVEALARLIVEELQEAAGDRDRVTAITERRPVVRFVVDRIIPTLNRPRPAGLDV
jgi:hypothetical protein